MNVVFINTTLESFTPTKSGAIGTWIWEVCQAAKRDGVEPLVISLRDDAEPYPWTKAVFLDYPRHDFNEGWKRILRKVFVLQAKFGGWYHMRHPAWARRVGDAIQRAGAANSALVLQNEPQLAVVLRRRFPNAFILHLAQNLDEAIHLVLRVVEVEAGSQRGRNTELGHERLVAVMAGAQRDTALVHHRGHVEGVGLWEDETHQTGAALLRTEDPDAGKLAQAL